MPAASSSVSTNTCSGCADVALSVLVVLGACVGDTACGAPSIGGDPSPDPASATRATDPLDQVAGETANPTYPAPHAALPVVDFHGGAIIEHPKIVTVTFDGDESRAMLDAFGDAITSTRWWDAVRDGYCDADNRCVGRGAGGGHGHLADIANAAFDDSSDPEGSSSLRDLLIRNVGSGTLPAPDASTIYVVYLPADATVKLDGSALCVALSAYHNFGLYSRRAADGETRVAYAYAVIPSCGFTDITATSAASHEIIEAATNPTFRAFYMRDVAWTYDGAEDADLCVTHSPSDHWEDGAAELYREGDWLVQRSWSNAAAVASHDPCVPAPAGVPYFNVAPSSTEENVSLHVGAAKTVELTAFSDAPMPDFEVDAEELAVVRGEDGVLDLSLDRTRANNGTKIALTVSVRSKPKTNPVRLFVIAKGEAATHAWPMTVFVD
jgi:hypothetical protein